MATAGDALRITGALYHERCEVSLLARRASGTELAEDFEALKAHLEAADAAAGRIARAFSEKRAALRTKLEEVHKAMKAARKAGRMPTTHFPSLKGDVEFAVLEAAVETYSTDVLGGLLAADTKEEFAHAVFAVYSAMGSITHVAQLPHGEAPPMDEMLALFRTLFNAVLRCKGILGKADKAIERMYTTLKTCLGVAELVDRMTMKDLAQMEEIADAMMAIVAAPASE
jgi:hypothetical protein